MRRYKVNEIFLSVQGEGARQGDPSVFVRFTGCNLRCAVEPGPRSPGGFDCDTEFMSGRWLDEDQLVNEIAATAKGCYWLVLTGGEPLLQVDEDLTMLLKGCGYNLALETNGTRRIPAGFDWVAVSPKVAEHAVRAQYADELRYVRGYGQGIPRPARIAQRYFLSPAFDGNEIEPRTVEWCRKLCEENPRWELSIQQHKLQQIR